MNHTMHLNNLIAWFIERPTDRNTDRVARTFVAETLTFPLDKIDTSLPVCTLINTPSSIC